MAGRDEPLRFTWRCTAPGGDVNPALPVGRELLRRGHGGAMAAPPNLIHFVESAGVPGSSPTGPIPRRQLEADFSSANSGRSRTPVTLVRKGKDYITEVGRRELRRSSRSLEGPT